MRASSVSRVLKRAMEDGDLPQGSFRGAVTGYDHDVHAYVNPDAAHEVIEYLIAKGYRARSSQPGMVCASKVSED